MMFDVLGNCISQVISDLDRYSGSPFHKDHVPLKVEVVVIPKPIHHIQQCLLVNVGKFNQQHTDVNLLNELSQDLMRLLTMLTMLTPGARELFEGCPVQLPRRPS